MLDTSLSLNTFRNQMLQTKQNDIKKRKTATLVFLLFSKKLKTKH